MVTSRATQTEQRNGSAERLDGNPAAAVFVDLDRTLLRGASGLALSAAMHAEGLFEGRRSLPGERLLYGLYDLMGESLAFMAMVRAAPALHPGMAGREPCAGPESWPPPSWPSWCSPTPRACWPSTGPRGDSSCSPRRRRSTWSPPSPSCSGSTTWSPPATRASDGRYTGGIDGRVRVVDGQAGRRAALGGGRRCRPGREPRLLRQRVRPARCWAPWAIPTP